MSSLYITTCFIHAEPKFFNLIKTSIPGTIDILSNGHTMRIETSGYSAPENMIIDTIKHIDPEASVYYLTNRCDEGLYYTNDRNHVFFKEKYILEISLDGVGDYLEFFHTIDEAYSRASDILKMDVYDDDSFDDAFDMVYDSDGFIALNELMIVD